MLVHPHHGLLSVLYRRPSSPCPLVLPCLSPCWRTYRLGVIGVRSSFLVFPPAGGGTGWCNWCKVLLCCVAAFFWGMSEICERCVLSSISLWASCILKFCMWWWLNCISCRAMMQRAAAHVNRPQPTPFRLSVHSQYDLCIHSSTAVYTVHTSFACEERKEGKVYWRPRTNTFRK